MDKTTNAGAAPVSSAVKSPSVASSYDKLILTTEQDFEFAQAEITRLLDLPNPGPEDEQYLERLSNLVIDYESAHYQLEPVSTGSMLSFLLCDGKGVEGVDEPTAVRETGIDAEIFAEYLADRQQISAEHRQILAQYFHVSPAVFD